MTESSIAKVFYIAVLVLPIYWISLAVYRLYFHRLAKFPGPKLTAVTFWCQFYYDVIKRGKFMFEIISMHEEYGPIVRINPNELHISDPEFYDDIYGSSIRRREKYAPFYANAVPNSTFATLGHDHHRLRRGALNPFFSARAVTQLEPLIQEKVQKLADRFSKAMETGQVIRADVAYTALTMDVISRYSFARDDDHLAADDFRPEWKTALIASLEGLPILRAFPWIVDLMKVVPQNWVRILDRNMALMLDLDKHVNARIKPILDRTESELGEEQYSHKTIFHQLRDSSLPLHEKTLDRLKDDGQIILGAGTETTANALAHITFYLLSDKDSLNKLRTVLKMEMPTSSPAFSWNKLEQLPYLAGVIYEGLRISLGVTSRLPRIAPDEILTYKDWIIPFGTPISSSSYFVNMNPKIFPNPTAFQPDRWIKDGKHRKELDKYVVNFGRGPRQCLGMNLAYAELYITVATVFRRFEMELFETTLDDVLVAHDFFGPVPRLDSKGIRVRILGEVKD